MKGSATILILMILATAPARAQEKEAEGYKKQVQVTPLLRATTTSAGQPIVYPNTADPEVTAVLVEIPEGAETGWHEHPFPCYAYVVSGEIFVEVQGGATNRFTAGQALRRVLTCFTMAGIRGRSQRDWSCLLRAKRANHSRCANRTERIFRVTSF